MGFWKQFGRIPYDDPIVPNANLAELLATPLTTETPPAPVQPTTPEAPTLDIATARALVAAMEDPTKDDPRCTHCRGIHDRACPRVRELTFAPAGQIIGVKFWKEWDDSATLWPEDIISVVMQADAEKAKKDGKQ